MSSKDHQKDREQRTPIKDYPVDVRNWFEQEIELVQKDVENDEKHCLCWNRQYFKRAPNKTVCFYQNKEKVYVGTICKTNKKLPYLISLFRYKYGRTQLQTNSSP